MRRWDARRIAAAAGAELIREPSGGAAAQGPSAASIDSRSGGEDALFFGLRGEQVDGGSFAAKALAAGAWGVLVAPEHADAAGAAGGGALLVHPDPLAALGALAREWRRELGGAGAQVIAITGSTGKTSTKDILAALLAPHLRTAASPANLNTEIGLPLAILAAEHGTEALVLEMAMRGRGQIAQLTAIAEPDVGVIVNVGPAHLELLGSLEAIAAAKAELIAGLAPGAGAVMPAGEALLEPHRRSDLRTVTFGEHGDVRLLEQTPEGRVSIDRCGEILELAPSFGAAHNLSNLLAAAAAAGLVGVAPTGRVQVRFSAMRGERVALRGGVTVIDDCYNANPMSMQAALEDLVRTAPARRVAVLGDMLELGEQAVGLHRRLGERASALGVELLVTVGPLAAEIGSAFAGESRGSADASEAAAILPSLLREGDTVLVKGSRGVGLERVVDALKAAAGVDRQDSQGERDGALAPSAGGGRA